MGERFRIDREVIYDDSALVLGLGPTQATLARTRRVVMTRRVGRSALEAAAARLVSKVGWRGRESRRWSQAAWLGRQLRELKTATGERLPDERIAAIVRQWDSSHDKPLSGRELMKALRGGRKRHALEPATPLEPMGGENVTGSFLLKGML